MRLSENTFPQALDDNHMIVTECKRKLQQYAFQLEGLPEFLDITTVTLPGFHKCHPFSAGVEYL